MTAISHVTLGMLVAPTAMGKSTIMNTACTLDRTIHRVKSFTTRPPRANDEQHQYIYVTPQDLPLLRQSGKIITEVAAPTTGYTYGTLTESYPGELCVLDTLASSVSDYTSLPFRTTHVIGLIAPAARWHTWLLQRYPVASDDALKRLEEATYSLEWLLSHPNVHWINNDSTPESAARQLIECMKSAVTSSDQAHAHARDILHLIAQGGIWS